jgi:hypothetical protein
MPLFQRAQGIGPPLPAEVERVVIQHYARHFYQRERKKAQEGVRQQRLQQAQELAPAQAGGDQEASPKAGGFEADMTQSFPGGQSKRENPGPDDGAKVARPGRQNTPTSQSSNTGY